MKMKPSLKQSQPLVTESFCRSMRNELHDPDKVFEESLNICKLLHVHRFSCLRIVLPDHINSVYHLLLPIRLWRQAHLLRVQQHWFVMRERLDELDHLCWFKYPLLSNAKRLPQFMTVALLLIRGYGSGTGELDPLEMFTD